jgi:hypothetical protein
MNRRNLLKAIPFIGIAGTAGVKAKGAAPQRPQELNNTMWMDLNVIDYIPVKRKGYSGIISSHPPFPADNKTDDLILWRVQVFINGKQYHTCMYRHSERAKDLKQIKEHLDTAVKRIKA